MTGALLGDGIDAPGGDGRVLFAPHILNGVSDASDTGDAEVGEPGFAPAMEQARDDPDDEQSEDGEGVFGEAVPAAPIEPGAPSIENAAFVVLGVASMIALIVHLASIPG